MSRDIDRQIAELVVMDLTGFEWMYPENHHGNHEDNKMINWETQQFIWVPLYSTDWNAMRLLVEWLQGKGMSIQQIATTLEGTNVYRAVIYTNGVENGLYIDADSAPLALCKAVLSLPEEAIA